MKAVLIKDGKGPAENLYLGDVSKPDPRHGEVLVKVYRSSSNVSADLVVNVHSGEGVWPQPNGYYTAKR